MILSLKESVKKEKPILGGHETFTFRNGWLKKGVDAVISSPLIFAEEEAPVKLGVGKNMVRSIKHWCLASNLLEENESIGRSKSLKPSILAKKLLFDNGWDPYLERKGSLWLIHWQIATNRIRSLIWAMTFSEYLETEFSKLSIFSYIKKQLSKHGIQTTDAMIMREIECCLHTYVTTKESSKRKNSPKGILEEYFDCPLTELDLIRYMPEFNLYHFNMGPKPSLPVEIFGYSLLKFIASTGITRSAIALEECLYKFGSPGQVFKLDENSIVDYLLKIENRFMNGISLIETAGLNQVYLSKEVNSDIESSAQKFLQSYYD